MINKLKETITKEFVSDSGGGGGRLSRTSSIDKNNITNT